MSREIIDAVGRDPSLFDQLFPVSPSFTARISSVPLSYERLRELVGLPPTPEQMKRQLEELNMYTDNGTTDIDREVARRVKEDAAKLEVERRLAIIKNYGSDTFVDGDVIRFRKTFEGTVTEYTYAALKAGGKWYITGPRQAGKSYSWEELLTFLVSGTPVYTFETMMSGVTFPYVPSGIYLKSEPDNTNPA